MTTEERWRVFFPILEDFFAHRGVPKAFPHSRILLFLDIDGVVRIRKGPVAQEIVALLDGLSRENLVRVVLITGAPAYQLPRELLRPSILLDRAFAESGGVERFHDGTLEPHQAIIGDFKRLESCIGIDVDHGLVCVRALGRTIIREGTRLTSFTAIMGDSYPPLPHARPSARHEEVRSWLSECIRVHGLPFVIMEGHEPSYSYLDVVHKDVGKERRVDFVLGQIDHDVALYIGDGTGDEAAMALPRIIPVALENSTTRIKDDARRRGFTVQKSGPDGTYEFLSALRAFLTQP